MPFPNDTELTAYVRKTLARRRIEELVQDFKKRWAQLPLAERNQLLQIVPERIELARILGDKESMDAATFVPPRFPRP